VTLNIPHSWKILPGIGHDPMGVLREMGDDNWTFYRQAFGYPEITQKDVLRFSNWSSKS
jgi:hypothetical protein